MAAIGTPQQIAELCSEYRGSLPLILAWVLGSTATIVVGLRLYVKIGLGHKLGWDDYTIVIALVSQTILLSRGVLRDGAMEADIRADTQSSRQRHLYIDVPFRRWTPYFLSLEAASFRYREMGKASLSLSDEIYCNSTDKQQSTIAQIIEVVAIMFMKMSLIFFLQRIIDRASRRVYHFLTVLNVFIVLTHFAPLMLYLLQCRPLPAVWDPTVKGECYSNRLTYTAAYIAIGEVCRPLGAIPLLTSHAALDVLTDLICAAIPILVISKLQMELRMKIAISILMSLGVL